MRAIFVFAWTQFRRFLRDPMYLFFTFAFPLIFLFIFGNLYKNNSVSFNIAVFNHSESSFAKEFSEKIESNNTSTFKISRDIKTIAEAKEKVSRGEMDSIIELPAEFGEIKGGAECAQPENARTVNCLPSGELIVYYDPAQAQTGQMVASIMDSVVDEINQGMTGSAKPLSVKEVSTGIDGMSTFDYIFAGLFAYTLMAMSIYGLANQLPTEKKAGSLRRIKATPFRPWQLIMGLALVYGLLTAISAGVMITVGVTMFGWQMQGNWFVLVVFSLLSILSLSGFGMLVAGAAKNDNQASLASQMVALPMMFMSGVFIPLYIMPSFFQTISHFIPLTPVAEGLRFITTEGAGFVDVLPQIGLVALWGAAVYFVAFKVFHWE